MEPPPESQLPPTQSGGVVLQGRNHKQFFSGGKGGFETSCPLFVHDFLKRGRGICQPAKNGTVAQNSTNRHKPAQTGTNKSAQFLCCGRGEAHPLFIVCCSSRLHQLTFMEWQYRHSAGNTRSGGHLLMGHCKRLFPCCWRHNCRRHHCDTIFVAVAAVAFGCFIAPSCHHFIV